MGRSRSYQRLVSGPAPRRLPSQEHAQARGGGMPRIPRIHADARYNGGGGTDLSQNSLWADARRIHARHALLSHRTPERWGLVRYSRSRAALMAHTRIQTVTRNRAK